jgi:hypothetical protein
MLVHFWMRVVIIAHVTAAGNLNKIVKQQSIDSIFIVTALFIIRSIPFPYGICHQNSYQCCLV